MRSESAALPSGRLARFALELQSYDYEIEHGKGSLNLVPDALSRMHEDDSTCDIATLIFVPDTQDEWYVRMLAAIRSDPARHKEWNVISDQLYTCRPNSTIDDYLEDDGLEARAA